MSNQSKNNNQQHKSNFEDKCAIASLVLIGISTIIFISGFYFGIIDIIGKAPLFLLISLCSLRLGLIGSRSKRKNIAGLGILLSITIGLLELIFTIFLFLLPD